MLKSLKRFVGMKRTSVYRKRRLRTPPSLEQLESRRLLVGDIAQIGSVVAEGEPTTSITYSYEVNDAMGNVITSVDVGQAFSVNVYVRDSRSEATSDPTRSGVFAAGLDLGVSNPQLVAYQFSSDFLSGIQFGSGFVENRGGSQGSGINLPGFNSPTVQDGQFFTVVVGANTVNFEFDWNGSTTAGRRVVALRNPSSTTPEIPLSFTEVGVAVANAINASTLGATATYAGQGVIQLNTAYTLVPQTSLLSNSQNATEYFNEVRAFQGGSANTNPLGEKLFFTVNFIAQATGEITFTPNVFDRLGSENLIYGNNAFIPVEQIDFGSPFSLTITPAPTDPLAVGDMLSTVEDNSLTISTATLLANDIVDFRRSLTVTSISPRTDTLGTLVGNVFTPRRDFVGTDFLQYTIVDSAGLASTGQIAIQVTPVNDLPIAVNDSATTLEDTQLTLSAAFLLANDLAGPVTALDELANQQLSIVSVGNAVNGSVRMEGANIIFSPTLNAVGNASFVYTISDGLAESQGTVNIQITGVNDAPVAQASNVSLLTNGSYAFQTSNFLFSDVEGDALQSIRITNLQLGTGDTLRVNLGTGPVAVINGTTVLASQLPTLTYTPAMWTSGARASFDFTVNDSSPGTVAAKMTMNVNSPFDFGDASTSCQTTVACNGPYHTIRSGLSLGATVSSEGNAVTEDVGDDGVVFSGLFKPFLASANISVVNSTGQPAYVSMWIDFNGDGTFASSENVLSARAWTAASDTILFNLPSTAKVGPANARIRLSTDATAIQSPTGPASDGEVEDYQLTIAPNPYHNTTIPTDVNGDNFVSPIDVLRVINWINDPLLPNTLNVASATFTSPYIDVNNDGLVTPADVQIVISFLNARNAGTLFTLQPEGESSVSDGEEQVVVDSSSNSDLLKKSATFVQMPNLEGITLETFNCSDEGIDAFYANFVDDEDTSEGVGPTMVAVGIPSNTFFQSQVSSTTISAKKSTDQVFKDWDLTIGQESRITLLGVMDT